MDAWRETPGQPEPEEQITLAGLMLSRRQLGGKWYLQGWDTAAKPETLCRQDRHSSRDAPNTHLWHTPMHVQPFQTDSLLHLVLFQPSSACV